MVEAGQVFDVAAFAAVGEPAVVHVHHPFFDVSDGEFCRVFLGVEVVEQFGDGAAVFVECAAATPVGAVFPEQPLVEAVVLRLVDLMFPTFRFQQEAEVAVRALLPHYWSTSLSVSFQP